MKLGVMIEGQEGIGWPEWKRIVQATEDLGFESLWRSDHFFSIANDRGLDCLETFVSLTYAANNSSRIRFGPLVSSMTFREPSIVARMAAAIDQLSQGRFILGIGAGWNQAEHDAFGIELPPPKARLERLEESAIVIRRLLSEQPVSFEGKHLRLKDAYVNPKPAQARLPLLIGGGGMKRTLAIVARHADEWNMPAQPLDAYREKVAALEAHCERAGRDPATIARSLMCAYVTAPSSAEVERRVNVLRERLPERFRPAGGGALGLPWLVGTPSQLVEQIQALEAEGVSRIMLQHREVPNYDDLELVAREVLPRV